MYIKLDLVHLQVLRIEVIVQINQYFLGIVPSVQERRSEYGETLAKDQTYHGWKEALAIREDCHEGRVVLGCLQKVLPLIICF